MTNQGKQTELVKREIINCVIDRHLKKGDRIPTQAELRKQLGVGNAVIGRAVQALTEDGILESRGRAGVVICSSSLEGYAGRTIGILCHHDIQFVAMAVILQNLEIALNRRACQPHLFLKKESVLKDSSCLEEFSGVIRAIEHHQIDGLLSTVLLDKQSLDFCRAHGVPVCYVSVSNANGSGVNYNTDFRRMMEQIAAKGYRRPMLIHFGHPVTEKVRKNFLACAGLFDFGKTGPGKYCRILREDASASWLLRVNREKEKQIICEVKKMSAGTRPDILIANEDDMLATWIALDWPDSPPIVHLEIAELGYSWPLRERGPYFLFSAAKLTEQAVQLLLDLINGRTKEPVMIKTSMEWVDTGKEVLQH